LATPAQSLRRSTRAHAVRAHPGGASRRCHSALAAGQLLRNVILNRVHAKDRDDLSRHRVPSLLAGRGGPSVDRAGAVAHGRLFLALTLLFLHGAVFTSRLPVPVDEVAPVIRGAAWWATSSRAIRSPTTRSSSFSVMQVAREELSHLRAPLWNRTRSRLSAARNGSPAPFSPLFLATLFVPLPKQIVPWPD